jgi:hypothetical protein
VHETGQFQIGQRRIGLRHEQRVGGRQGGDEIRIDGEVVSLYVTGPARSPVTVELLLQEELAALGDKLGKITRSCGRSSWIEPERCCCVIGEADLPPPDDRRMCRDR